MSKSDEVKVIQISRLIRWQLWVNVWLACADRKQKADSHAHQGVIKTFHCSQRVLQKGPQMYF